MCSKCYKEVVKVIPAPKTDEKETVEHVVEDGQPVGLSESVEPQVPAKKVQTKKDRCLTCNKKLRLAQQFSCKCEYVFCSEHRYADKHDCEFDFAGRAKELIAKANPTVVSDKLNRI
eukprot:TRINITY_DN149_c0_g1_i1.p1 TRINITY_DN149_c0_g1~~TRINITY_DN149_c0_g1_i1.p1  ORF type:complete len:117 (+),score=31.62 TRINITY_DN149_c0_g1_i1:130-480(+)